MLMNATRICEAKFGVLWLSEQERFRCVALHNAPPAFAAHYRDQPLINPPPGTGLRRLFETRQVTQVSDMTTIKPYIERRPVCRGECRTGRLSRRPKRTDAERK